MCVCSGGVCVLLFRELCTRRSHIVAFRRVSSHFFAISAQARDLRRQARGEMAAKNSVGFCTSVGFCERGSVGSGPTAARNARPRSVSIATTPRSSCAVRAFGIPALALHILSFVRGRLVCLLLSGGVCDLSRKRVVCASRFQKESRRVLARVSSRRSRPSSRRSIWRASSARWAGSTNARCRRGARLRRFVSRALRFVSCALCVSRGPDRAAAQAAFAKSRDRPVPLARVSCRVRVPVSLVFRRGAFAPSTCSGLSIAFHPRRRVRKFPPEREREIRCVANRTLSVQVTTRRARGATSRANL